MVEITNEAEFNAVWNDRSKVLGIVFDPSATTAANTADGVAGNAPDRLAVWIKDAALAASKRTERGCGAEFTTCFYCLQRHNVTGLGGGDEKRASKNDIAFGQAEVHD